MQPSWLVAVSGSYVMNSYVTFAAESGRRLRWRAYGTFVASGRVLQSAIQVTGGNVTSFTAGSFRSSTLYVGYRATDPSAITDAANNQTAAIAWTMLSGYHVARLLRFRPNGFCGRSCVLRLRPAFISLAHRSASIMRGSGPTSLAIAGGVARVRFGSNFRGISSHS